LTGFWPYWVGADISAPQSLLHPPLTPLRRRLRRTFGAQSVNPKTLENSPCETMPCQRAALRTDRHVEGLSLLRGVARPGRLPLTALARRGIMPAGTVRTHLVAGGSAMWRVILRIS
jgi:hypothetical protein